MMILAARAIQSAVRATLEVLALALNVHLGIYIKQVHLRIAYYAQHPAPLVARPMFALLA